MKDWNRFAWSVILLAAAVAMPSTGQAQLAFKTTGGVLEFQVLSGAGFDRSKLLPVRFLWQPELGPDDAEYVVTAECRRRSRLEGPPGSTNRLQFDLVMTPVTSGTEYDLGRWRRKLGRDGFQKSPAIWRNEELDRIASEGSREGVAVRFEISVRRGGLDFGDTVSCESRVTETDRRGIAIVQDPEGSR